MLIWFELISKRWSIVIFLFLFLLVMLLCLSCSLFIVCFIIDPRPDLCCSRTSIHHHHDHYHHYHHHDITMTLPSLPTITFVWFNVMSWLKLTVWYITIIVHHSSFHSLSCGRHNKYFIQTSLIFQYCTIVILCPL